MRKAFLLPIAMAMALSGCGMVAGSVEVGDEIDQRIDDSIAEMMATTTTLDAFGHSDEDLPEFPGSMDSLALGNTAWALVLGVSEARLDPALETADLAARAAGYSPRLTDCDNGEIAALELPGDRTYYLVSVYFSTETAVRAAEEAFSARGIGSTVARVEVDCID